MNRIFLLAVVIIFIFSIGIRLATLNKMGRTWDEGPYVEEGYKFITLLKKGDFTNSFWYKNPDHPPLARYAYGAAAQFDVSKKNGEVIFSYDYTSARIISVILASLTVVLVMLIGKKYFSTLVGIFSGIILSLLPLFVGYSQIATLESFIIFFFTSAVFSYLLFLEKPNFKKQLVSGAILGLALMVKQTNALLIPLLLIIHFYWNITQKEKASYWYYLNILGIGFITFIILWPMPWFNLDYVIKYHNNMWLPENPLPPPELIFGRFMLTPPFYYVLSLLITTPLLILILSIIGSLKVLKEKRTFGIIILIWFLFPFIQSLYHFRQHNIRYIIEIYAPFAMVAAIGFEYLITKYIKNLQLRIFSSLLLITYLLFTVYKSSPYYLTYFNGLVGGTKTVYEHKLFLLGWWGEGMKEAGEYLEKNAPKNSSIGIAISPYKVFPPLKNHKIEIYDEKKEYDYVVVSYFNVLREGFDDSYVRKNYQPVYSVNADGAKLVNIYKKK